MQQRALGYRKTRALRTFCLRRANIPIHRLPSNDCFTLPAHNREDQMSLDLREVRHAARAVLYFVYCEEIRLFGTSEGSIEQRLDRLLSAGAAVDPKVYEVAFVWRPFFSSADDIAGGPSE